MPRRAAVSPGFGFITSRRVLTADSPIRAHHPTAQAIIKSTEVMIALQRRQLEIVGAKTFWRRVLAVCVVLLLTAVGYFLYSLQFVTAYDTAFYTRLSISIPLTWAVGFCSFRYSRERKRAKEFDQSVPRGLQGAQAE